MHGFRSMTQPVYKLVFAHLK